MVIVPNDDIPSFLRKITGQGRATTASNPDEEHAASDGSSHTLSAHTMSPVDENPTQETEPAGMLLLALPRRDPHAELPIQISNSEGVCAAFALDDGKAGVCRPVKVHLWCGMSREMSFSFIGPA